MKLVDLIDILTAISEQYEPDDTEVDFDGIKFKKLGVVLTPYQEGHLTKIR